MRDAAIFLSMFFMYKIIFKLTETCQNYSFLRKKNAKEAIATTKNTKMVTTEENRIKIDCETETIFFL